MTKTLPGADIRGYYAALGVEIPGWAPAEATVRCFANPDAHQRGDRNPSCSINLGHGAWHCHGCGAKGGAFDAATARGYTDRAAIDLMVAYGITEYHPYRRGRRVSRPPAPSDTVRVSGPHRATLGTTDDDIARWHAELAADPDLIRKLARDRGWLYATMLELELGVDHGRITIPVRGDRHRLTGVLRYQPWPRPGAPKMLAAPGSRRVLLPHPAADPSEHLLLVEGEPDMIAARSRGLPAIAVPGVDGWRAGWAPLFSGRRVTVVMDCDEQGRAAARIIARDLARVADAETVDLCPRRSDGYDLTDWLLANPHETAPCGVSPANVAADFASQPSPRGER